MVKKPNFQKMVGVITLLLAVAGQAPPPAKNGADCGAGITCYPCLQQLHEVDPRGYPSFPPSSTQPSCSSNIHPGECVGADGPGKISSTSVPTFADCCAKCSGENNCVAWTYWIEQGNPKCE